MYPLRVLYLHVTYPLLIFYSYFTYPLLIIYSYFTLYFTHPLLILYSSFEYTLRILRAVGARTRVADDALLILTLLILYYTLLILYYTLLILYSYFIPTYNASSGCADAGCRWCFTHNLLIIYSSFTHTVLLRMLRAVGARTRVADDAPQYDLRRTPHAGIYICVSIAVWGYIYRVVWGHIDDASQCDLRWTPHAAIYICVSRTHAGIYI
jgi:hypothetical protein